MFCEKNTPSEHEHSGQMITDPAIIVWTAAVIVCVRQEVCPSRPPLLTFTADKAEPKTKPVVPSDYVKVGAPRRVLVRVVFMRDSSCLTH